MFGHIFKNRLKTILRNKSTIFWTLLFPLMLGTFFFLAFSGLSEDTKFKKFDIAVVNDENYINSTFSQLISSLEKEAELFNISYTNEENAKLMLEDNKITGYYVVEDEINIVVKKSGINQTIMKYVVDNYYQTYSIMANLYSFNSDNFSQTLIEKINSEQNHFNNLNNDSVDFTVVFFYTLIGMVCIYAGFFGIDAVSDTEANLSKNGARISISPTHKLKVLLIYLLVGLIIQYIETLILLGYLGLILGVNFGNQLVYILILTFVGNLAGLSLGTFIGASNKKSVNTKVGIFLTITMTCSFLAGMMSWQMKYIVDSNAPLLGHINPVSLVTDALYSLYYYDTLDRYLTNIIYLLIFSTVMILTTYILIRRKKYDSI